MPKVKVYNIEGKETGEIELPKRIFDLKINDRLVHQAAVAQSANSREAFAHTKHKGEVRGGGKKPWKQKGTGRARHGSIRSPLWKGGGIVFGPRPDRNFSRKINKKMKMRALFMVLSGKLKDNEIVVVENFNLEKPSTKKMENILNKLPLAGKVMISLDKKNENIINSAKNIPYVSFVASNSLNVVDLLSSRTLLMNKEAVKEIEKTYKREFNNKKQ